MSGGPFATRRLHFIGIGGAGMSGLALVARALGAEVSGSDRAESAYVDRLRRDGIEPTIPHDAAALPPGAEVIVSTAIPDDNPELLAAREAGLEVRHRVALLAELAALKRAIAVTGTHGKTTTAAMVVHALATTGRDPAYLVGGELRGFGTNAGWGTGEWVVVEADESDRSLLELSPDVAVVTSMELDHHESYGSLDELAATFNRFAEPAAARVAGPGVELDGALSYGIDAGDLRAEGLELAALGSRFRVDGVVVELAVPGRHNVLNALAALAACRAAGVELAEAAPTLGSFAGTGRRFEDHGTTAAGARVFDDYAHHPTEVDATLRAARILAPRRLVACFQPHLFSRTRRLARDFGRALALADVIAVLDVYPARERAEDFPGVTGLLIAQAAADRAGGRRVLWLPGIETAERFLAAELREGDVLLTMGAGDVDRIARALTS